jgi:hypothetical protein
MKPVSTLRQTALATAILLAASSSAALTMGRLRGAALVGQSLDVVLQVRLEAGDDPAGQCFEADVFHADTRVDASRVRLAVEPGATAQDLNVRIRSLAVVDEPVVTLYVRAGCTQKMTRRYVILADVAPDAGPAVVSPVIPSGPRSLPLPPAQAPVARPAGRVAPVPGTSASAAAGESSAAAARRARRAAAAAPVVPADTPAASAPAPARASAAPAPAPAAASRRSRAEPRARLKLDPIDLTVERDPTLRPSTELLVAPVENDPRRAEAAALWRALNAQPQDILRDTQRLQGLESDVRQLREQGSRTQASLAEVKAQLDKSQKERYQNELVYGLGALLAAVIALAAFLWYRGRSGSSMSPEWWNNRGRGADDNELESGFPAAAEPVAPPKVTAVDVDLGVDETMFESLKTRTLASSGMAPLPPIDHRDFVSSTAGGPRAVNAEELFDIQQQADFFISLGQHDQAIEVLKNHISDNVETSALAYLDLLKIYHTLGSRADYDALREDFNRVFNAQVPVFDAFSDESSGLEAYHNAMARIVALWPSHKVLEVIEESIFRKPGSGDGEAFDLEAYRELLMLYAIAKEVVVDPYDGSGEVSVRDSGSDHSRFSHTAIQPLSAGPGGIGMGELATDLSFPPASSRLGLDIDLSALPPANSGLMGLDDEPTATYQAGGGELSAADSWDTGAPDSGKPDDNLIDFDLFDSSTEDEIAPKPRKR